MAARGACSASRAWREVFAIGAHQPGSLFEQCQRLAIQPEDGTCPFQKRLRILDMLPGVVAPGTKTFCLQPAANRAGRNGRQLRGRCDPTCQFAPTPSREWNPLCLRQATSHGSCLCTYTRREKRRGAPERGASAKERVATQRFRHLRTMRSLVPLA